MGKILRVFGTAAFLAGMSLGATIAVCDGNSAGVIAYKGKVLLDTSADTLGKAISYPVGTPRITSQLVTLEPGKTSTPNIHQTPMYLQVLSGELTVDYGEHGKKVYKAGEAFVEAQGVSHHGINAGTQPVTFVAVYIGAQGIANETSP